LCYAKITPAALHRGDFRTRCVANVEALGRGLEFRSGDFSRVIGARIAAIEKPLRLA
jgi:hypothetical protein